MTDRTKEVHRLLDESVITHEQYYNWYTSSNPDTIFSILQPLITYMNTHSPSHLFKLRRCCKKSFNALDDDQLFLTRADHFNDPYDCLLYFNECELRDSIDSQISYDGLKATIFSRPIPSIPDTPLETADKLLEYVSSKKGEFLNQMATHFPDITNILQASTFIASLCEEVTSPVMWAHYAENHTGFAIEYEFPSDFFYPQPYYIYNTDYNWYGWRSLLPVQYSSHRQSGNALAEWYCLCEIAKVIGLCDPQNDFSIFIPDLLLKTKTALQKSSEWSYEKEWRLILSSEWPNRIDNYRVHIPMMASAIYLGSRIDDINKKELISIADKKGIPIYKMYIDNGEVSYKMSYRPL